MSHNDFLDIFDDLYNIKNKINDNEYINLNNKVKLLLDTLLKLKSELNNSDIVDDDTFLDPHNGVCTCHNLDLHNDIVTAANVSNYFCSFNTDLNCNNFIMICEYLPLLKNIYQDNHDINFTNDIIENNIERQYWLNICTILIAFNRFMVGDNMRIIVVLVLYDFIFRHFLFLEGLRNIAFRYMLKNRYLEFCGNVNFITALDTYQINKNRWLEIINDL